MATDGNAAGTMPALLGWRRPTRRLSALLFSPALARRLLLLGACGALLWCGLAFLGAPSASAAETEGGSTQSGGLLGGDLLGRVTGTLTEPLNGQRVDAQDPGLDRSTSVRPGETSDDAESTNGGAALGSLSTSVVRSTGDPLAPVRGVAAPTGDLVPATLEQPMLLTAHGAGQTVLEGVATKLGPLTRTVPLSASMPVTLDPVTSQLAPVSGAVPSTGSVSAVQATDTYHATATGAGIRHGSDQDASDPAPERSAPQRGTALPAQPTTSHDGHPLDGAPAPSSNTSPSTSHQGNGSGSAGSAVLAELPRTLAPARPAAVVPTTDADISSGDEGRPSVSPD